MKILKNLIVLFLMFVITFSVILFVTPNKKNENTNDKNRETIVNKVENIEDFKGRDLKNEMNSVFIPVTIGEVPNGELQKYKSGQEYLDKNKIVLTAEKVKSNKYISSRIETAFSFKYGDFSFKIKDLRGKGLLPAIWMLPASGENYPELDIYEHLGDRNNEVYGVLHQQEGKRIFFKRSAKDDTYTIDFHWDENLIQWSIDGETVFSASENIPTEEMFMIMNLAVGGEWPGEPDESVDFPKNFEIEVLEFKPQNISLQEGILNAD